MAQPTKPSVFLDWPDNLDQIGTTMTNSPVLPPNITTNGPPGGGGGGGGGGPTMFLTSVDVSSRGIATAGNPVNVLLSYPYALNTFFGVTEIFHGTGFTGMASIESSTTPAFDYLPNIPPISDTTINLSLGLDPGTSATLNFNKPLETMVLNFNSLTAPAAFMDRATSNASTYQIWWNDLSVPSYNWYVGLISEGILGAWQDIGHFAAAKVSPSIQALSSSVTFPMNEARYLSVSAINSNGVESPMGYPVKVAFSNTAPTITGVGGIVEGGWVDWSLGIPDGTATGIMFGGTLIETPYKLDFLTLGDVLIDTCDLANPDPLGPNTTYNNLTAGYSVYYQTAIDGPYIGTSVLTIDFLDIKAVYSTVRKVRLTNYTGSATYTITWL